MIEFFETLRKIGGLKGRIAYAGENHAPGPDMMAGGAPNPEYVHDGGRDA